MKTGRIPLQRMPGNRRPTRIPKIEQLCGLVESLTRCIIQGFTQQIIFTNTSDLDQLGMPPRNQQRHKRKLRRIRLQHRRQKMPFHVMHAYCRDIPGPGEASCNSCSRQQCTHQPRPSGIGDALNLIAPQTRLSQRSVYQRQQLAQVIPRCQLRHHTTIICM